MNDWEDCISEAMELLGAENYFAVGYDYVVEREAVAVGDGTQAVARSVCLS